MLLEFVGDLPPGLTAKDMILGAIGQVGVAGGVGYVVEYAGEAIRALSMEQRMTICNMTIEWGARAGMIAPDETTFAYLEGRPHAPAGEEWERAVAGLALARAPTRTPTYDTHVVVDVAELVPQVTWGTNPGMVVPVTGTVPDPATFAGRRRPRSRRERALEYMGLRAGPADRGDPDRPRLHRLVHELADRGSPRGGGRSSAAARSTRAVTALVVPGSAQVRRQAQAEGLDQIFLEAGFEWRLAGCSMCLGMNPDVLAPGRALRLDLEPQLRGPPGPRRPHAPRQPPDGRRSGAPRALRRRALARRRGGAGMKAISQVEGRVAVLDRPDVDTDQIIPKQFLKRIERTGYGQYAFFDWRFDEEGNERPGFELNQPQFAGARILLAGRNFGCGSSREHAAWALQDYGFDVVIAPSFGDIFRSNAAQIGMVLVELPEEQVKELMESVDLDRGSELTVDLEALTVTTPAGKVLPFEFDESTRYRLLNGLDDIGITLQHDDEITAYEQARALGMTAQPTATSCTGSVTRLVATLRSWRCAAGMTHVAVLPGRRDRAGGRGAGGPGARRARDRPLGACLRWQRDPRPGRPAPRRDARRLPRRRRRPARRRRAARARGPGRSARAGAARRSARSSASTRTCARHARPGST